MSPGIELCTVFREGEPALTLKGTMSHLYAKSHFLTADIPRMCTRLSCSSSGTSGSAGFHYSHREAFVPETRRWKLIRYKDRVAALTLESKLPLGPAPHGKAPTLLSNTRCLSFRYRPSENKNPLERFSDLISAARCNLLQQLMNVL